MTRNTLSRPGPAGPGPTPVPLLEVRDLKVHFPLRGGRRGHVVRAVDGVSFDLAVGETLGLVGESGCGKTTVGRALLGLVQPTAGRVRYRGETLPPRRRAPALRRAMQIVFQDPTASLNPRMRVGQILAEPMLVHRIARGAELTALVDDLLVRCGLWTGAADRYPHAFSGGQRQRIAIARALALRPDLIVCDEPTSALDVSIQSQILNLLSDLQDEFGLSYLFISHDMAVVNHLCDRVAVMNAGKIVEIGPRDRVIRTPTHEYTRTLLAACPELRPRGG